MSENLALTTTVDSKLDDELTEWLKINPLHNLFAQPEKNIEEVILPEHLEIAFSHRMKQLFAQK